MPLFAISQTMINLSTRNMPGDSVTDNMRSFGLMLLSQSSATIIPRLSIGKDELLATRNKDKWLVCDNLEDALAIARAMIYLKSSETTDHGSKNQDIRNKQSPVIFKFDINIPETEKLTANVMHDYCRLSDEQNYNLTEGLLNICIHPMPNVALMTIDNSLTPIELHYLTVKGDCYTVSVNSNPFVNYMSNALAGPKNTNRLVF